MEKHCNQKCRKVLAANCAWIKFKSFLDDIAFQIVFFESNFAHFFEKMQKYNYKLRHLQSNPTLLPACTTSGQYTNVVLTPTYVLHTVFAHQKNSLKPIEKPKSKLFFF